MSVTVMVEVEVAVVVKVDIELVELKVVISVSVPQVPQSFGHKVTVSASPQSSTVANLHMGSS